MIHDSMAVVDVVEDSFQVDYFGGDLTIQTEYRDLNGATHTLCISAHAIRDLAEKLHEAQMDILAKAVKPSESISFVAISGPTRGEIHFPGRKL
jgi:hypothetical protein